MKQRRDEKAEALYLQTLPYKVLVRRQGIVQSQIPRAYEQRQTDALEDLQMMDKAIQTERLRRLG